MYYKSHLLIQFYFSISLNCSEVLQFQYLNIAEIMSSMTTESRVNQHSIQPIDLRLSLGLRHEGLQVQVFWIFHILMTKEQLVNIKLQCNIHFIAAPYFNRRMTSIVHVCQCTFVILPPVKFAKRLSERVSTLELRWMVNLFEAVTIFLHLGEKI